MVKSASILSSTQKTVLIHSSYGLWPVLEYELDIVQRKLDEGYKVIFLTCNGDVQVCEANKTIQGKIVKRYCTECKSRVKNGLRWLSAKENQLEVQNQNNLLQDQKKTISCILKSIDDNHKSQDEVRSIVNIENIDIYESALSTLITDLQISTPNLDMYAEPFVWQLRVALESYYSAINCFEKYKPDEIYVYNGRFSKYRPMLRQAKYAGILVRVYEYPYAGYEKYITINNDYPHNLPNTARLMKQVALESPLTNNEIVNKGEAWFNSRIYSRDQLEEPMIPTYNYWQKTEMIGKWDERDYNIVFFVSSEHEICAIQEVKKTHPYGQIEAIRALLLATTRSVIHVRIHPNLQDKDPEFLARIIALEREVRLNIIMPRSAVDSYALMKMADLVVTFGSTAGIEAAYLRKPVITVGASFYEEFPATVTVVTHNQLVQLVKAAENADYSMFPPLEQRYAEACKFGYAFLNFGNLPVYLSRQSYAGGVMQFQGVSTPIKASWLILIFNRLLDLPSKLLEGAPLLLDPYKRKKLFAKPFSMLIKKLF